MAIKRESAGPVSDNLPLTFGPAPDNEAIVDDHFIHVKLTLENVADDRMGQSKERWRLQNRFRIRLDLAPDTEMPYSVELFLVKELIFG